MGCSEKGFDLPIGDVTQEVNVRLPIIGCFLSTARLDLKGPTGTFLSYFLIPPPPLYLLYILVKKIPTSRLASLEGIRRTGNDFLRLA